MKNGSFLPFNLVRSTLFAFSLILLLSVLAFSQARPVPDIYSEVNGFVTSRSKDMRAAGKKITSDVVRDLKEKQKDLAKSSAAEVSARKDLQKTDYFYLGMLYSLADDDDNVIAAMKKFVAEYPANAVGDAIQSARGYIVAESARLKRLQDAEAYYALWLKGSPVLADQQPILENAMAAGYYKNGQYDLAVKHAQSAFDLLKTLKTHSEAERRDRESTYMNLIEILALSYKRSKNSEKALEVLAEARAQSFAIPSANLYRKVMDFVEGSGFSEKKLMQKVESYASADPAPTLAMDEWLGMEPTSLDKFRGKVVLLDFWATWCGPCISTFPRLRGWYKKYAGDDFVMVGVTQYDGSKEGKTMSNLQELDYLKTFKDKFKIPYPIAVAHAGEAHRYGINVFPTTVLLDRKGVVRYIGIGAGTEESSNLEDMIKEVMKENSASAAIR